VICGREGRGFAGSENFVDSSAVYRLHTLGCWPDLLTRRDVSAEYHTLESFSMMQTLVVWPGSVFQDLSQVPLFVDGGLLVRRALQELKLISEQPIHPCTFRKPRRTMGILSSSKLPTGVTVELVYLEALVSSIHRIVEVDRWIGDTTSCG